MTCFRVITDQRLPESLRRGDDQVPPMERSKAYLQRKRQELSFLAGFLARPPAHLEAESVDAVVALKFRLGALLKAERVLADWSRTETNWAHAGQAHRIGPYALHVRTIRGPT